MLEGLAPNTEYCYRVYLGTGAAADLLGTDASPQFWSQLPRDRRNHCLSRFSAIGATPLAAITPTRPT